MTDDRTDRRKRTRWEKVDEIVSLAIAAPTDRRTAFIKAACGRDLDLRREVESLLQHVAPSEQLFSNLSAVLSGRGSSTGSTGKDELIGQAIRRYEIKERYSSGMSCVYRAWDPVAERPVILKLAPQGLEEGEAREVTKRLQREAYGEVMLRHPNVCEVFDSGEAPDGRPFLVMEFCEGLTLRDKLAERTLELPEVLTIGAQIADALAAAHQVGLTHRDVKPSNVMIDDGLRVKLLDFGIAKLEGHRLTRSGRILGTLEYMSPEQVSGLTVSSASDIFSLGCLLQEAATGLHPFRRGSKRETVSALLEPRPPDATPGGRLPAELQSLLRTMLSREPAERPTAARVREVLVAMQESS